MKNAIKVGVGIGCVVAALDLAYAGAMELIVHRADAVVKTWHKSNRKNG